MIRIDENGRCPCKGPEDLIEALGRQNEIRHLSLSGTFADGGILRRIVEFKQLESLFMSSIPAFEVAPILGQLLQLEKLAIRSGGLKDFPSSLLAASNLTSIDLYRNRITTIPEGISSLSKLKVLELRDNRLTALPDAVFSLPLVKLNVMGNKVVSLSNSLGKLTAIEELFLSRNAIESVPDCIGDLKALKVLLLRYNNLKTLPASIGRLKNLTGVFLEGNPFESLPKELQAIANSAENFSIAGKHRSLFMDWAYIPVDKPPVIELDQMNLRVTKSDERYADVADALTSAGAAENTSKILNAISISSTEPDDYSIKGCSRLGGFPDLANESLRPKSDNGLWWFVCQINLSDVANLNSYLPREGLLSFFMPCGDDFRTEIIWQKGDLTQLVTFPFKPSELIDDQDDYTENPHRVSFSPVTDIPFYGGESADEGAYETVFEKYCAREHCINGYTYTQHESPETQAADRYGGKPEEWVCLLKLGWDKKVGFCFWDAGTLTFVIHREDLRREDFSRVRVSIESS